MSIITYPLNDITYSASDAETYLCTRTSGVYSQDGMFAATAIGGRQVQIAPGLAWINNATFKGKSVVVTEPITIDVDLADANSARIDRIVLRFDAAANASVIDIKKGTAGAQPQAPAISRTESLYELALCDVSIAAGSVTVEQAHLTSKILDESVCGIMRDAVTGIPTQDLYDQFEAWQEAFEADANSWMSTEQSDFTDWRETNESAFDSWQTTEKQAYLEWLESIQTVLDEDTAGHLLNMINSANAEIERKADTVYVNERFADTATRIHEHDARDITGGTFSGAIKANDSEVSNLSVKQVRNIIISNTQPSEASNGDIWLFYSL